MISVLKKIWRGFEFTVGVLIPSTMFFIMFVSFCIQIFSRYVLNHQFEWTYEFTVIGFMWTVVFGAVYASKHNEHVSFSLIYDRFGPKGRAIIGIIGNLIIITAFCLMYFPTIEYVIFIGIKTTPVLKVPFDLMYAPFVLFITFSGGYLIRDIGRAIVVFRTPGEILAGMEEYRKEIMYLPNEEKETLMKEKEAALKAAYAEKKGGERV